MGTFDNIFADNAKTSAPSLPSKGGGQFNDIFSSSSYKPTPVSKPTAPTSVVERTGQGMSKNLPGTTQALADLQSNPLSFSSAKGTKDVDQQVFSIVKGAWDSIAGSFGGVVSGISDALSSLDASKSPSQRAGEFSAGVAKAGNAALSPITALFTAAGKVPVVGTVAKLISLPFIVAGDVAPHLSNAGIDAIPDSVLSPQAKQNLKPGIGDLFALASQIALGKGVDVLGEKVLPSERAATTFRNNILKENPKIKEDLSKIPANTINDLVQKHGPEDAKTIVQQAVELARQKRGLPASTSPVPPPEAPTGQFGEIFGKNEEVAPPPANAPEALPQGEGASAQTPSPVSEKGSGKGTVITVNGVQHELTGAAEEKYLREKSRSDQNVDLTRRMSPSQAEATAKGESMKLSALKRDLTGKYTGAELTDKIRQERSNYNGKRIVTDVNGRSVEGTIQGKPAYGRFKVKLDDGAVLTRTGDRLKDIRTNTEVINKITARSEANIYEKPPKETPLATDATPVPEVKKETNASPAFPKELQPLAEEAKKYKSAAEFEKAAKEGQIEIPIDKIRSAEPSTAARTVTQAGRKITEPVEVIANQHPNSIRDHGEFTLLDGNHRLQQARLNGDKTIKATVDLARDWIDDNGDQHVFKKGSETLTDFYNKATKEEVIAKETPLATEKVASKTTEVKESPKTSGLSKGVEAKAIEKKLTTGFEGKSEYESINIKDQANKAAELISKDPEQAKRIALGQEEPPQGLKSFAVYTAVEEMALKQGDIATLRDLATNSSLNAESSGAAQTLRLLAERDPESPVSAMKDIQSVREKALKARLKTDDVRGEVKKTAETIRVQIKKTAPTRQTVEDFIKSIQC